LMPNSLPRAKPRIIATTPYPAAMQLQTR
jgi:hypothetical protein